MRSRRLIVAAFFDPGELGRQLADLGVEFLELLGMRGLFGRLLLRGLPGEEARETGKGDIAPAVQLIGMDLVLGGELANRLFFFQQLSDDLGLEGG